MTCKGFLFPVACAALLGACSSAPTATPARAPESSHDIIAAIHAAGQRDQSVLSVTPLRDPALQLLLQAAQSDVIKGNLDAAAKALARARVRAPSDPEVVQHQAEVAVRQQHYVDAERLARQSFELGPKLGSLCARNWQTVIEMRQLAHDAPGAQAAREALARCQIDAIKRM